MVFRRGGRTISANLIDGHSPRTTLKNKQSTEMKTQDYMDQGDTKQEAGTSILTKFITGRILWHICTIQCIYVIQVRDHGQPLQKSVERLPVYILMTHIKLTGIRNNKKKIKNNGKNI